MQNHAAKLKRHITSVSFRGPQTNFGLVVLYFFLFFSSFGFVCGTVTGHSFCLVLSLYAPLSLFRIHFHVLLLLLNIVQEISARSELIQIQRAREQKRESERYTKCGREKIESETRCTRVDGTREKRRDDPLSDFNSKATKQPSKPTKLPLYAYETYQNQQQHKYIYRII